MFATITARLSVTGALDTVKMDLVLRALAFLPEDRGNRQVDPGFVRDSYRFEALHDLARPTTYFRGRKSKKDLAERQELKQVRVRTAAAEAS
jgi:hypothetical protein